MTELCDHNIYSSCYDHLKNKVSDNPVDKDFNGELLMDVQRLTNTHTSQGGYVYNECDRDSGLNLELAATVGALSEDIPLQLHYNNTLDGFNETLSELCSNEYETHSVSQQEFTHF